MSKIKPVLIDARAAGYAGDAIRLLALTTSTTGKILIQKQADWREPATLKDDTVLVTDTPMVFDHWDMAFNESEQIKAVLASYNEAMRSNLIKLHDDIKRYNPSNVIQTRKMDERGQVMDFDSMNLNNGHMAVLLAVWVARRIHGGYVSLNPQAGVKSKDDEPSDDSMLPFSC